MKWFDWVSIYWHSQLLHTGVIGWLTGHVACYYTWCKWLDNLEMV